ncbi:hypothetical protein [Winogradskyella sp.]|uniref:hypothetical protein n=1 Tax=Winogradskyella sp. TaxID=1883156 RepID=UPI003AB70436
MNKYSFIKELLENKKFNSNQKERFLKLVSKELQNTSETETGLINDVNIIKRQLGLDKMNEDIIEEWNEDHSHLFDDTDLLLMDDDDIIENDFKEYLLSFNLEYLENSNRDINPINSTLEERIIALSKLTDKSYKDRKPLIELFKEKHSDLYSSAAISGINRVYFVVKQIEVMNGDYEHHGISTDTLIIPRDIMKQIKERTINPEPTFKVSINDDNDMNHLPEYYYPSSMYKFLLNYNQNPILKSTCHDIGSQELEVINNYCDTVSYDFNKHLEKIIETYDIHEKKYFAPSFLKTRFRVYLTGKNYYGKLSKGWSEESISINWSSPELKEWSKKNPGIPPNLNDALIEHFENTGFENFEGFTSKFSGIPIQSFTQLIYHFKHSFHLNGNNSLRSLIERINEIKNWNEQIDFIIEDQSFPFNIEHFTDVEKLIQTYKSIIELIIEVTKKYRLEKPKVKLTAIVSLEEFQFTIHHLNSVYKKAVVNTLERLGQHYRNLIEKQVNGLCNLILNAEFESGETAEINIWNGKERKSIPLIDKNFKGVKHILQFPKK